MSKTNNVATEEHQYEKVPTQALLNEDVPDKKIKKYGYGVRHVQAIVIMLSLTLSYSSRSHLGMSIVGMTAAPKQKLHTENISHFTENNMTLAYFLPNDNETTLSNVEEVNNEVTTVASDVDINKTAQVEESVGIYRTYNWSKATQEMVLGSFFLGYCVAMIPFGIVTQRWGGKIPLQISLFINAVTSIISPWVVLWGGWKAICACRICQGIAQAGTYPSVQTLLAKWSPASELATLSSFVFTGSTVGTVVGFQMSGFLVSSPWGWPSAFWASGALCLLGFFLMTFCGAASPYEHKSISQEEKNYILGQFAGAKKKRPKIPVKAVLSNKHVWATFISHAASGTAYVFFYTQIPTYLHFVLKFKVKDSGILSSLPFIVNFFFCIVSGWLSDYLINKEILKIKTARRIMNSFGFILPAASVVLLTYSTNKILGVFCLISILSTHATIHSGWMINYIDLSPKFSGTMMAIGNTLCNTCVLILPVLVSNFVTDVTNVYQWRGIFFLISSFLVIASVVFLVFVSTDAQPFDEVIDQNTDEETPDDDLKEITEFEEKQFNIIRRKSLTPFQ